MAITLAELGRLAGVSASTASRALSGKGGPVNGLSELEQSLEPFMGGQQFPVTAVFHEKRIVLLFQHAILLTNVYQIEIAQPNAFRGVHHLFDEFLNGRGQFDDQLFGRIPRGP